MCYSFVLLCNMKADKLGAYYNNLSQEALEHPSCTTLYVTQVIRFSTITLFYY